MATKTITLTDESYEILKNIKKSGESFSEAIKRMFLPKPDIMKFAGIMRDLSEQEGREIIDSISELRSHSVRRYRRR